MKVNRDMIDDSGRTSYAFALLESSGYVDGVKDDISYRISDGTPDDIEIIIEDLLLNQVDRFTSFTDKSIIRRINTKFM